MKLFRRHDKGRDTRAPLDGEEPTGPRLSAITAWALAHGVPYSHVVPEFLEDVQRGDERPTQSPDNEGTE